ncbi:MAG: DUF4402 domain-containing protein [Bacteroidetes bacterium]|nr:DUF4402 domain-containing protein [Bacteroidota bacterium]
MKKLNTLSKIIIVLVIIMTNYNTFGQITCTGTVFAEIVPATVATEIKPLSFGQFSTMGNGGNVVVSPQGTRTSNGSVMLSEGVAQQGIFSIFGTQNNTVQVILPSSPVYIYHQNGVNYMYLDTWTVDMPKAGSSKSNSELIVSVGSTLHVGSTEVNPIGSYACTYPIIFVYN